MLYISSEIWESLFVFDTQVCPCASRLPAKEKKKLPVALDTK